jgi:hypothetical protein
MHRPANGPQIYIALLLAAAAATVTLPTNAVAHYRALASVVMQAFTLEGQAESVQADGTTELSLP